MAPVLLAPTIATVQTRRRQRAGVPDNVQFYVSFHGVDQAVFRFAENQQPTRCSSMRSPFR